MPIFGRKPLIPWKLHYFMGQKSEQVAHFPIFKKKSLRSCPYFIKATPILWKNPPIKPIFCQKTSILSKKLCSYSIISKFFNAVNVKPIFDQKTSILSKQHYIMSQRSQYDALFFPISHEKIITLMPIFCEKTSIL